MDFSDNGYVCSVNNENQSGCYRLHTTWTTENFSVIVISNENAWRGEMTKYEIINMSKQLNMGFHEYFKQCKEALTTHNGQPGVTYVIENDTFTWKKMLDEDSGIKIKMGTITLDSVSFTDSVHKFIDVALYKNNKLEKQVQELESQKDKENTDRESLLNKVAEITQMKSKMENELYSKFMMLLNSKKAKIAKLQDELAHITGGTKANTNVQMENAYDVNTDEDDDEDFNESNIISYNTRVVDDADKSYSQKSDENMLETMSTDTHETSGLKIEKPDAGEGTMAIGHHLHNTSQESQQLDNSTIPSTKDELLAYFYGP